MSPAPPGPEHRSTATMPTCPVSLRVGDIAAMLNAELADDPVYDGIELQWFDDDAHGTGMLAFLSRRADRTVDYYAQAGLRLDRTGYGIGGGIRSWNVTGFESARLKVHDDGVTAHARFTDIDGRDVVVDIDDRDGRPRRRAGLLAPVGSGIEHPTALMLVWMAAFDLVRVTARAPVIAIDGRAVTTGALPGARLHGRHLIKYASRLCCVEVIRDGDAPAAAGGPGDPRIGVGDGGVSEVRATSGAHHARVAFAPAWPDAGPAADRAHATGRWFLEVDGHRLTGGTWLQRSERDRVAWELDVRERWHPRRLPVLMRIVTAIVPVFRRWPTTYAWNGAIPLDPGAPLAGGWRRTAASGDAYRRATGSARGR